MIKGKKSILMDNSYKDNSKVINMYLKSIKSFNNFVCFRRFRFNFNPFKQNMIETSYVLATSRHRNGIKVGLFDINGYLVSDYIRIDAILPIRFSKRKNNRLLRERFLGI